MWVGRTYRQPCAVRPPQSRNPRPSPPSASRTLPLRFRGPKSQTNVSVDSSLLEQNVNFNIHLPREPNFCAVFFHSFLHFKKTHKPPQNSANEIFSHKNHFFLITLYLVRVFNQFTVGPLSVGLSNPECMTELLGPHFLQFLHF